MNEDAVLFWVLIFAFALVVIGGAVFIGMAMWLGLGAPRRPPLVPLTFEQWKAQQEARKAEHP